MTRFRQAAGTTTGRKGIIHGPWAVNGVEATANGKRPPADRLTAWPSRLWNDPHGRGWGDAFRHLARQPPTPTTTGHRPPAGSRSPWAKTTRARSRPATPCGAGEPTTTGSSGTAPPRQQRAGSGAGPRRLTAGRPVSPGDNPLYHPVP